MGSCTRLFCPSFFVFGTFVIIKKKENQNKKPKRKGSWCLFFLLLVESQLLLWHPRALCRARVFGRIWRAKDELLKGGFFAGWIFFLTGMVLSGRMCIAHSEGRVTESLKVGSFAGWIIFLTGMVLWLPVLVLVPTPPAVHVVVVG